MENKNHQWVIQERLTENDDTDWDVWIIGIIEESDMFVEQFRTNDKEMAIWAINVFHWFECFEEQGIIGSTAKVIEKVQKAIIAKRKAPK